MLLDKLVPSRCTSQSDALRRASELHAISTLAVGAEARKTQRRVADFRVTADAAERRARQRSPTREIVAGVLSRFERPANDHRQQEQDG